MTTDPENKADNLTQKAANEAAAVRMEAEVIALELVKHTKEIAAKAETMITLAENKAKSLVESAAKDAVNIVEVARQGAAKLYEEPQKSSTPSISVIANDIGYIKRDVAEIKGKLEQDYVTRVEFEAKTKALEDKIKPLTKIAWGIGTVIGLTVATALLTLVIKPNL